MINDPSVEVRWAHDRYRPAGASRLNTELFAALEAETKKHYGVDVLPTMSTGASDQERILEAELYRFVRFQYDVVMDVARAK